MSELIIAPLDEYRLLKSAIEHEDNLINHRLSWFFGAESFLFMGTAIAQKAGSFSITYDNNFYYPLLPGVGIASCLLVMASIFGGIHALNALRAQMSEFYQRFPTLSPKPVCGRDCAFGLVTPIFLPLVFLAAWVLILLNFTK